MALAERLEKSKIRVCGTIVLCLLLAVSVTQQGVQAGGMLQPSGDVFACPGAVPVYTCEHMESQSPILQWQVGPEGVTGQRRVFSSSSQPGAVQTLYSGVVATLNEVSATRLLSTLTVNTTALLENERDFEFPITIECIGRSFTGVSTLDLAELPEEPGLFEVTSQSSQGNASTLVVLSWSPPTDNGGATVDQYSLTFTPSLPPPSPFTILTNDTTVAVSLPSNRTYSMRVRARNCVGTSVGSAELSNVNVSLSAGNITCVFPPEATSAGSDMNSTSTDHKGTEVMSFECSDSNSGCTDGGRILCNNSVATTDIEQMPTTVTAMVQTTFAGTSSRGESAQPSAGVLVVLSSAAIAGIACAIAAVFIFVVTCTVLLLALVVHHNRGASKKVTLTRGASNAVAVTEDQDPQSPIMEGMYSTLQTSYQKPREEKTTRNCYHVEEVNMGNGGETGDVFAEPKQQTAFCHVLEGEQKQQPPFYHVLESSTPIHCDNSETLLYDEVRTFDKPVSKPGPLTNPLTTGNSNHPVDGRTVAEEKADLGREHATVPSPNEDTPPPIPPQNFYLDSTYANTVM